MKLPVLTAAAGAGWEATLLAADGLDANGVTVARRCVDIVELLAVAVAGQGRAALLDADLRRLDADAVDRLTAAGVIPVAVVARGDSAAELRMHAFGVRHVVPDDSDPAVVAGVITQAVNEAPVVVADRRIGRAFGDPLMSMPVPSVEDLDRTFGGTATDRRGSVVAVWGPTGAPGRTTLAIALADEIARLGSAALLIDADVYGATVASVLGLLDESPGLAAACRLASTTRLDVESLAQLCWQVRPSLRVLTGIATAQRWPEIRASALDAVLSSARALADFTVVDCGFGLETDEELSFDSLAPRRNGATLAALDAADLVIVVGAADPIGIARLVRGLAELRDAEIAAPLWVVVNKIRRTVVPGDASTELAAVLGRFAGVAPAALLPHDQDGLDAALSAGRLLADVRGSSPLRKAVAELASAIVGVPAKARHRRR